MASSQPILKYALVLGLKELNKIVTVNGDDKNYAPVISKSDVGFVMLDGIDIGKEASYIIIIDNNFSRLVVVIIYGRNIYNNISQFLQFQLTINFCAYLLVFICSCIGNKTSLTTIQMLWINLIMDSLGSLALAIESSYDELLNRKTSKRDESIKMEKFRNILEILDLEAQSFIKENDIVRLSENNIIKCCCGKMIGNVFEKNIIYGQEQNGVVKLN